MTLTLDFMSEATDKLARVAVAHAVERHRRLGESIVIMRDGKVVEIPAEQIPPLDGVNPDTAFLLMQQPPAEPLD